MDKISLAQKKIIIVVFIGAAAFLLFWLIFYLPARVTVSRIRQELSAAEDQIQGIEGMLGKGRSIEAGMKLLQERSCDLDAKFPEKEEESLRMLSLLAQKMNLEVISLRPEPKSLFLNSDSKKLEIEGKACYKVSIAMEMKGSYKDLLRYIAALKESLTAYFSVENLKILKDIAGAAKLNINLDLNLYLLP